HLVRSIRRAKRAGGRLVVVDPLRTKIAEQADLHLQLLPGTDVLLAWSVAAELERSGALDQSFIAANALGFEDFMARAREWPAARFPRHPRGCSGRICCPGALARSPSTMSAGISPRTTSTRRCVRSSSTTTTRSSCTPTRTACGAGSPARMYSRSALS